MQLKCLRDVPVCFKDWPKDSVLRFTPGISTEFQRHLVFA